MKSIQPISHYSTLLVLDIRYPPCQISMLPLTVEVTTKLISIEVSFCLLINCRNFSCYSRPNYKNGARLQQFIRADIVAEQGDGFG
jgi:hypothetical protein